MSPRRSKAIVFPSGETSRDIHVPSSVVNSIVSALSRTSEAGARRSLSWSDRSCVWTTAAAATSARTAAPRPASSFMTAPDGSFSSRGADYSESGGVIFAISDEADVRGYDADLIAIDGDPAADITAV